jgi:hypothetical protein
LSTARIARRCCIFVSAGERHNIKQWLSGDNRSWDLITAYYGESEVIAEELRKISDTFVISKGSKFQNLRNVHLQQPNLLSRYDYVWVVDDDIIIEPAQIDKLFDLARFWGLWVSQPAFDSAGKVSHHVTRCDSASGHLRISNFVEVTCPLFKREKLEEFLNVYDGSLSCYGLDYWWSQLFKAHEAARFGIFDEVTVINPKDAWKSKVREIDKLNSHRDRQQAWIAFKRKHNLHHRIIGQTLARSERVHSGE